MRHGSGNNQKGNNQTERIEVVTKQGNNAQPPDAGDNDPRQRDQHPVGLAEIEDQQGNHDQGGKEKNFNDLVQILIGPAHQHWLAGCMNADTGGRFLGA